MQGRPRRLMISALWLAGAIAATSVPARAQTPAAPPAAAPHLQIPRATTPPRLDDYLGTAPGPGVAVSAFLQRDPKDLEPATQRTTAYLSYDNTNLYVAFVCDVANHAELRARMSRREAIFSDDFVAVHLDTFHDRQRAYEFLATPLGIQADGILSEQNGDDFSFDTQWQTRGRITDTGYVVFFEIPFKRLRFQNTGSPQSWGIALQRVMPARNETVFWPGITHRINGFASQFATLDGIDGVHPGRNIQLVPYATFAAARVVDETGSRYVTKDEERAGLDAKIVARDAVTVDLTARPDFSQVESDEPQVTVNQRFEVFFPEKRPFFLENADFFSTPITLFFSRRIRDPDLGARVTGKAGGWAFGGVVMDDRAPGHLVAPDALGFDERAVNGIGRVRYDFANQSSAGGFVSTRSFAGTTNQVVSGDTRIRLNKQWFFTGQLAGSSNQSPDGTHLVGNTAWADLSRSGRAFTYDLTYSSASPDFRSPLGFVPRLDVQQLTNFLSYRWWPKKGNVISFGPNSFEQATWNAKGELQDWIVRFPFNVSFKRQTSIFGRHALISEKVNGADYRQREELVQFNTSALRWLDFFASWSAGTRPNYSPAEGLPVFLGNFTDTFLSTTFRPTSALLLDETYIFSRLTSRPDSPGTRTIFSNHIARSRVNYQFTREWSLRAILDYNTLSPNPALVDLSRGRHVTMDVLLTWLLHPGTALYVGYTDGYDNVRLDPLQGLLPTAGQLASTGRQIFVKTSWLF
jgi:Domain of unknown function (DUF5916)